MDEKEKENSSQAPFDLYSLYNIESPQQKTNQTKTTPDSNQAISQESTSIEPNPTLKEQEVVEPTEEEKRQQEALDQVLGIGPNYIPPKIEQEKEEEELLKAFIGKNYDKIKKKSFSFACFFFGPFYLFYRKIYSLGLIFIILSSVLYPLTPMIATFILFALQFLLAFFIKKIYLNRSNQKIMEIKQEVEGKEARLKLCSQRGGTSKGGILFVILIQIVLGIMMSYLFTFFGINTNSTWNMLPFFSNLSSSQNNETFDGMIIYNGSINMQEEYDITVPNIFENQSSTQYDFAYNPTPDVIFSDCTLHFSAIDGYSSASSLATLMAEYYEVEAPTKETINHITWYHLTYPMIGQAETYLTQKDNQVYLYQFTIGENADASLCQSYHQLIIHSITAK